MIVDQLPHEVAREQFAERHRQFLEQYYPRLMNAIHAANARVVHGDPIIFYLGIRIARDFEAILLLVSSDMAIPAQSLLRGLFERCVNLAFLHAHPNEIDRFGEFDFVQRRKLWRAIRDLTGADPVDDKEALAELERNYARVKDRYVRACDCGKESAMTSWSKLDTVAMAKQLPALAPFLVEAYHRPLLQAHSTLQSLIAGMEVVGDELRFLEHTNELSDRVFYVAHGLLLVALEIELAHYPEESLSAALRQASQDFHAMHPSKEG